MNPFAEQYGQENILRSGPEVYLHTSASRAVAGHRAASVAVMLAVVRLAVIFVPSPKLAPRAGTLIVPLWPRFFSYATVQGSNKAFSFLSRHSVKFVACIILGQTNNKEGECTKTHPTSGSSSQPHISKHTKPCSSCSNTLAQCRLSASQPQEYSSSHRSYSSGYQGRTKRRNVILL